MSVLVAQDGGLCHAGKVAVALVAAATLLLGLVQVPDAQPSAASAPRAQAQQSADHP